MEKVSNATNSMRSVKVLLLSLVAVFMCSVMGYAQDLTIKGKVSDTSGQPLPGVSVIVKGTTHGSNTDIDGNYVIKTSKNSVLVFSCIGLTTQDVEVSGRSIINVTMEEDSNLLSETIVVGYGTQKKSSLTSAVSAIKGDELLKAPSTNVSQVLAGKLPGISSVQESGEPGLDQASLRIRGSIYSVSYVVDGYPVPNINDIDPQDIESISVLKDGASAAVYGLQSAGGVIIITTKKGDTGKAKITYNGTFGASFNANFPQFMNGPQFAYYYNMAQMMDQLASGAIESRADYVPFFSKQNVEDMLAGRNGFDNVNYIDKVFGTGFNMKHNVTVQGGNDKTRYFVSFGYMDQKGNIDKFEYQRYNVRANLSTQFAKNWNFRIGLAGILGQRNTPAFNSGGGDNGYAELGFLSIARQTIQMHPYLPVKDAETGLYTASHQKNTQLPQSPLAAIYESGYKKTRSMEVNANVELSYNVPWVSGLVLKVNGAYGFMTSHNKNLNTLYEVMEYQGNGEYKRVADPRGTSNGTELGEGQSTYESLVGQASISYNNVFGKNTVGALLLAEMRDNKSHSLSAYAKNLPFVQIPELGSQGGGVPTEAPIGGWSDADRSAGYILRLNYDYDSRYLVEFTGRYDGSYNFYGMGNQWGFFPSGSIGWRISNESFMKNAHWLDDLKVRASVGLLGSDSVSPYSYLATYAMSGKVIYPTAGSPTANPMIQPDKVPNMNLSWEKTLSYNVGVDATFWKGLLGLEVDGFYNYTYDIIGYQGGNKPDSMGGYFTTVANTDKIDSKGIDVLVSHKNSFMLGNKPFIYGITANITYSKTRWLKTNDSPNVMEWQKSVGQDIGAVLMWKADGLYRSEEEIDNSAWMGTRPCIGDIKYVDLNGDGQINNQDRGYFGRTNRPQLTYGLNLDFAWNGFDLNAQFTGGAMFDVLMTGTYYNGYDDNTIWTQTFKENANSPLYLVKNAYSIDNPNGTFPRLTLGGTGHGGENGYASSFWTRDGKYIRLKSAQLGYTLPNKITSKIGIQTLRFFVEGANLFTIDGLPKGIDPESPGVNNGYYPQQRTVMGGVTLTF